MKSKFKISIPLYITIAVLIVYILCSIALSIEVNRLLKNVYMSKSYDEFSSMIFVDEVTYNKLDCKSRYSDLGVEKDSYNNTFPIVLIGIRKCKVKYKYTYLAYDDNADLVAGSWKIHVSITLGFKNGKFTIINYDEKL